MATQICVFAITKDTLIHFGKLPDGGMSLKHIECGGEYDTERERERGSSEMIIICREQLSLRDTVIYPVQCRLRSYS